MSEFKFLVSSSFMHKKLVELGAGYMLPDSFIDVTVEENGIMTLGQSVKINIEFRPKGNRKFQIKSESFSSFAKVVRQISDQPITVGFDDNRIELLYAMF